MSNRKKHQEGRMTDEDGKILKGCEKCRHFAKCCSEEQTECPYDEGMSPHYVFHLGKHKGKTLSAVMESDAQYLLWMTASVEWFEMSKLARSEFLSRYPEMEKQLYKAEVDKEIKFETNKIENDADIQADFHGGSPLVDEE